MCNRYGYQFPYQRLLDEFSELGPVNRDRLEPNEPRVDIRPTDRAPIIREGSDGAIQLIDLRWGFIPANWTGTVRAWQENLKPKPGERRSANPMTNARSENIRTTTAFRDSYAERRCLVPASQYFEWSATSPDPRAKKTMFRFTVPAQEVFAFPGIWSRSHCGADGVVESFALLTSAPGADQARYHNRQPVILERGQWADWLNPKNDLAASFVGSPAGSINVEYFSGPKPQGLLI